MMKFKKNTGFTLIELLITISIILLVTGGGIAGFINFNDRQQVQTTVNDVKDLMRAAQIKARVGEGADSCVSPRKLKGYRFTTTANAVIISLYCVDDSPVNPLSSTSTERSRVTLKNVTLVDDPLGSSIIFLALKGGVNIGNNTDITYAISGQYTSIEYQFQLLNTGEITEGAFQ